MKAQAFALSLCGVCLLIRPMQAQHSPPDSSQSIFTLSARIHQGFVLVHSRDIRSIQNSYPTGLDLDLSWHNTSAKAWASCHCYPKVGLVLGIWDFDNPEVLGYGLTSMLYIQPVFGARHRFSFSVRAGFGLSYQSRPHDPITNPDNLSYSTHVAFPLQLGGAMHIRLAPQWYMDVSALYNHISNGGLREPNKGINWPTAALGVNYYMRPPSFPNRDKKDWRAEGPPENRFDLTSFLTYHQPMSGHFIFSTGLELKYSRQIARVSALTAGSEWMYDKGKRYQMDEKGESGNAHIWGIALGHEFLLGRFLFSQQFGAYVIKARNQPADVYQRYGLMYRISQHFSLGINIKAHGHVANFLDARISVSL